MSAGGTRPLTLSGSRTSFVRTALMALVTIAWTAVGLVEPATAATRKTDKAPASKHSAHTPTTTAQSHKKTKQKRKSKRGTKPVAHTAKAATHTAKTTHATKPVHSAKAAAPSTKSTVHTAKSSMRDTKVAALPKSPGGKKHRKHQVRTLHARKTKRHAGVRVARRPHDPSKLVIPQGDGSPVLAVAAGLLGRPYRFGADHGAYDCSGFVRTVFAEFGIELPHSAREQFTLGDHISRDDLEPGDLVFFHTYRRSASHVGIYVGEDKFVHASTRGGQVQVDSLEDSYYASHYLGARRLDI